MLCESFQKFTQLGQQNLAMKVDLDKQVRRSEVIHVISSDFFFQVLLMVIVVMEFSLSRLFGQSVLVLV